MSEKNCIITIPPGIEGMDCQTNGMHPIVIVNALNVLSQHFARQLVAMAEKEVGKNKKLQEQWLDRITKKYLGDNPGDQKFDVNDMN